MSECIKPGYARVSDIISSCNSKEFDFVSLEALVNAQVRGERVHSYCVGYARERWLPPIEEECQPYFDSFKLWYDENVMQLCYAETRLYDDLLKITGRFDLIVVLKESKQITLVDLKSSASPSKSWPIQLAAYKYLLELNNYELDDVMNLQLMKNGKIAKARPPENLNASWDIFQCCVNAYDYFHRKKEKK